MKYRHNKEPNRFYYVKDLNVEKLSKIYNALKVIYVESNKEYVIRSSFHNSIYDDMACVYNFLLEAIKKEHSDKVVNDRLKELGITYP